MAIDIGSLAGHRWSCITRKRKQSTLLLSLMCFTMTLHIAMAANHSTQPSFWLVRAAIAIVTK